MLRKEDIQKRPINERAIFAFTPHRDPNDPKFLKQKMKEIRTPQYRKNFEYNKPKDLHRFHRLPPHQRDAAMNFFDELCLRHQDRIMAKPRFKNILHMIVLNRFKNPDQNAVAGFIKKYKQNLNKYFRSKAANGEGKKSKSPKPHNPSLPRSAYLPL